MAINVDLSKPLTEKEIEQLRTRLPEIQVQRLIQQASGEDENSPEESDEGGQEGEGSSDLYDPSEHTVEEVQTYLLTADKEEAERVLQAERDGKSRKSILES